MARLEVTPGEISVVDIGHEGNRAFEVVQIIGDTRRFALKFVSVNDVKANGYEKEFREMDKTTRDYFVIHGFKRDVRIDKSADTTVAVAVFEEL